MEFGWTLFYILAVFVFGGVVKGVIGMGLPSIVMGLLSVAMPPGPAASILVLPLVVTNVWQMLIGPAFWPLLRRLSPFLVGLVAGTLFGTGWLSDGLGRIGALVMGATLAAYGVVGLMNVRLSLTPAAERWLGAPLGLIAGLINAATAVFAIPAVPFMQALGLEKDELVQALGIAFAFAAAALAVNLGLSSALSFSTGGVSLAALGAASLGMVLGQKLRARLDPATFRKWFFIGLIALGLVLARKGLA